MADDYEVDLDDLLDLDDSWLYVEDEFNLADELAEGQLPTPGYPGNNYEIDFEAYEFDLFNYWDDLEYADDAYWDYGPAPPGEVGNGQKRKRDMAKHSFADKRLKTLALGRDAEPLIFRSREERIRSFFRPAPLLETKVKFAFLADWRERFANVDGKSVAKKMPSDMKRAAEGQDEDTPPRSKDTEGLLEFGNAMSEAGEDEWEDGDVEIDGQDVLAIDPEMIKTVLRERLEAAGLGDMDEEEFMQVIQQMMTGGGDDAAGALADSLLGKMTSDAGDEAVSGWLSRQGVSVEDEDREAEHEEGDEQYVNGLPSGKVTANTRDQPQRKIDSPRGKETQIALHSGSPTVKANKRAAPAAEVSDKQKKKVKFDVPSSFAEEEHAPVPESTLQHVTKDTSATEVAFSKEAETRADGASSTDRGRKRKATTAKDIDGLKPAKRTRNRELESLGAPLSIPSPAPPAKRTRSAKSKGK